MVAGLDEHIQQTSTNTAFSLHDDGNGIDISGWHIRNVQNAIASSSVEEVLSDELGIKLPGMLFDKSWLRLRFGEEEQAGEEAENGNASSQFEIAFNAIDALKMVGEADPRIKVRAAERWDSKSERSDVEIITIDHASDWTFSTRYPGTVVVSGEKHDALAKEWVPAAGDSEVVGIDYAALRNTELPILFSAQSILFEDELDDNGTASYKVRLRVMPSFWFALARFFLRVDGVLIRIYDTRYFHRFGSSVVVRETSVREADISTTLKDVHPTVLRDPDMAAQKISPSATVVENITIVP